MARYRPRDAHNEPSDLRLPSASPIQEQGTTRAAGCSPRPLPEWAAEAFSDLDEDVRQCIKRIEASPFIPRKNVRGFVYDVATGALREVKS
jgi:hypothetical protein